MIERLPDPTPLIAVGRTNPCGGRDAVGHLPEAASSGIEAPGLTWLVCLSEDFKGA
jgi:hypothetical protein